MSGKKDARHASEHAILAADLQAFFDKYEQERIKTGNIADPGEKIMALLDLFGRMADEDKTPEIDRLAKKRAARTPRTYAKRAAGILAFMTLVGAIVVSDWEAQWISVRQQEEERKNILADAAVGSLARKIKEQRQAVWESLQEMVNTCDLQQLVHSPRFGEIYDMGYARYHCCAPLHARFAAAAALPKPETAAKTETGPETAAAPCKTMRSYKHLTLEP